MSQIPHQRLMLHHISLPRTERSRKRNYIYAPKNVCIQSISWKLWHSCKMELCSLNLTILIISLMTTTKITVTFNSFTDQRQKKIWSKCSHYLTSNEFIHILSVLFSTISLLPLLCSMCSTSLPIQYLGVSEMSLKDCWIPLGISSLIDISVKIFHLVPVSIQVLKKDKPAVLDNQFPMLKALQ